MVERACDCGDAVRLAAVLLRLAAALFASEATVVRLVDRMNLERHLGLYAMGLGIVGLLFLGEGFMGWE